jgi:peptide/nickel transport system substrate-binding protein
MRKVSRYLGISLAIAASLATLASCAQKGGASGATIVFALTGDIAALDPAQAYDFTTNPVVNSVTEGLLRFSPKGELQPNLAVKWESPDPTTYVFTLRKGVKFQDGSALTVEDAVFSLNRVRDAATASPLAWMLGSVKDIAKVDGSTLKITLSHPDAQFRYALATTAGHVISKAYYEAHKANFGKPDGGLLGTGPFKFVSWKVGSEIALERFKDYWDKANGPFVDKALFKIVPEGATRIAGLKTGEIDATALIPLDLLSVAQKLDNVELQGVEGFTDDWVAFNTSRAPFDDPQLRKAVIYSFDAKSLLDAIVKDAGVPAANLPVGPALWTYAKDKWQAYQSKAEGYAYDPAKAKAALAASKHPKGARGKILTDGDSLRLNAAQAIQAGAKAIGVELEIEKLSNEELTSRQFSGKRDYDVILGGWGSDYPDPAANVQPFLSSANAGDGGSNFAAYKNKRVDELLDQQAVLSDDSRRADLLIEALATANADAPYIFIDHPKIFYASSKKVKGYALSPIWYWDDILRGVSKAK